MASVSDSRYISVVVCFAVVVASDLVVVGAAAFEVAEAVVVPEAVADADKKEKQY